MLIKERRLEEAEKRLQEKKQLLATEQKKLKALEEEAKKVHDHKEEKIKQLDEELDQGTDSLRLDVSYKYLKVVHEDLARKKKKVLEQDKVVKKAEEQVHIARQEMLKKQQEVEKLNLHKSEWKKQVLKEIEHKEAIESDEIGSAKYSALKRAKKAVQSREKRRKNTP